MSESLVQAIEKNFAEQVSELKSVLGEVSVTVSAENLLDVCKVLRDADEFQFEQLIDLCAVDYLCYGEGEWATEQATATGFGRGRRAINRRQNSDESRFSVIYHLLSVTLNQRIRLKVPVDDETLALPSVIDIWNGANWYEREAFDLFGVLFIGHPDLRRILTDYGFIGHPFRKDYPVIGELEMRFDAEKEKCVYEPVSIEERILVPKVIRKDAANKKV